MTLNRYIEDEDDYTPCQCGECDCPNEAAPDDPGGECYECRIGNHNDGIDMLVDDEG